MKCSICGLDKEINCFTKSFVNSKYPVCKDCKREDAKIYYINNKEKIKLRNYTYVINNKEKVKITKDKYFASHKNEKKIYDFNRRQIKKLEINLKDFLRKKRDWINRKNLIKTYNSTIQALSKYKLLENSCEYKELKKLHNEILFFRIKSKGNFITNNTFDYKYF